MSRTLLIVVVVSGSVMGALAQTAIVVGAGVAGLKAAYDLHKQGRKVIVLEARDRPYGRVSTQQPPGWPIGVELGAQWFHGNSRSNVVYTYATSLRPALNIVMTGSGEDTITFNGPKEIPSADERNWEMQYGLFETFLEKQQDRAENYQPLEDAVQAFMKDKGITDPYQVRGFRQMIDTYIVQEYAASPDKLSLNWFDADSEIYGPDSVARDGYSAVFASMYNELVKSQDVRLQIEVNSIMWSNSPGVTVQATNKKTGLKETFTADYVVCALPLGVLKAQHTTLFPSGLSPVKLKAINTLGMGLLNKVIMLFDTPFWKAKAGANQWIDNMPASWDGVVWSEFYSLQQATGQNILVAFQAGNSAVAAEGWTDDVIINGTGDKQGVLGVLRAMFGSVPAPKLAILTRWGKDPYAFGSYSYVGKGATGSARRDLCLPEGSRKQVYFAGEACDTKYPGTVQGAWLTGQKAAQQILSTNSGH